MEAHMITAQKSRMRDRLKQFSVVLTAMAFLFSSAALAGKGKPHKHTLPPDIEIPVKLKQLKSERHPSEVKYAKDKKLKRL
jgi:hypothetical protein